MNAMILAAGKGTRLGPLTDRLPKALMPLVGRPLLAILLEKLAQAGFDQVAINAHHHADLIADFLHRHCWPGMTINLSFETDLLDTGGGLVRMMDFLPADQPILVHNVDVLSTLDLAQLVTYHQNQKAMVTLAVQSRPSQRLLAFTEEMTLAGRAGQQTDRLTQLGRHAYAFNGIHVVEPQILLQAPRTCFSSIEHYLQLAAQGVQVIGFVADRYYWRDLGKPEDLKSAEEDVLSGRFVL